MRWTVTRDGVAVESDDGRVQMINLTIDPLPDHDSSDLHYLILFTDHGPFISREEALAKARAVPGARGKLNRNCAIRASICN